MRVASLPLTRVNEDGEQPTTILEILRELKDAELKDARVESIEDGIDTEIKTDVGVFSLKGASFNRQLLSALLGLEKEGINSLFGTH
jgi:hypothetical protein